MNKIILIGNLTKNVELLYSQTTNKPIAKTSIAVQRKLKNTDGEYESDFFNLVAFGSTAEFMNNYFSKGMKVAIEGRVQNRTWEDENGNRKYATDIIAEQVEFAQKAEKHETTNAEEFVKNNEGIVEDDDDLPF